MDFLESWEEDRLGALPAQQKTQVAGWLISQAGIDGQTVREFFQQLGREESVMFSEEMEEEWDQLMEEWDKGKE